MIGNWLDRIESSRLHTKLMATFILLLVIQLVFLSYSHYRVNKKTVLELSQNDMYTIVQKNNELLDAKLSRVREMIQGFLMDKDAYDILSRVDRRDKVSILISDLQLRSILEKYFAQSKDVYSALLVTSYFTFGTASSVNSEHAKDFIPYDVFPETALYREAWEGEGKTRWIPTYSFADMFNLDYLRDKEFDYKRLFSSVTLMNGFYSQNAVFRQLDEKPVLVVNFKESLFGDVFEGSLPTGDAVYFVVDRSGHVVYHPDEDRIASRMDIPGLEHLFEKQHGVEMLKMDGETHLAAFALSDVTGWLSVALVPPKSLLSTTLTQSITNAVISAIGIAVVFIGLSIVLSRLITEPFRVMIRAINSTGEGRFQTRFEEKGSYEFKVVMRKFTEMNENIQRLIQENYQREIREKEAQIKALNLQLDPHFMYNTLNMVSLMAMEKEEYEISDIVVSLSNMMKYLIRNDTPLVPFETDLMYLKSYIKIMTMRFEDAFEVEYDIDESLYPLPVPKFFLQPLVENAFVHGLDQVRSGGKVRIECKRDGAHARFVVEDNGRGIDEDQLDRIRRGEGHVGLMNVNERIKAHFGEPYGLTIDSKPGKGTRVTILLPGLEREGGMRLATP
jgi:two-component system sensor histidine kinase YesM